MSKEFLKPFALTVAMAVTSAPATAAISDSSTDVQSSVKAINAEMVGGENEVIENDFVIERPNVESMQMAGHSSHSSHASHASHASHCSGHSYC